MTEDEFAETGSFFHWSGELDSVTGIPPRKALDSSLPSVLRRMGGEGLPLSALMIDIDHFKKFNDTWGHRTGDIVLRHVAGLIRESVRYRGEAYRYGGEEITVLLPNTTSEEAVETAERIRAMVYDSTLKDELVPEAEHGGGALSVSISLGVSTFPEVAGSELLVAADQALYQAKNQGRNRVCAYTSQRSADNGKVTIEVTFPAPSSISEGSYIILTRWFQHGREITEIEAREISDLSRGVRDIAEGRPPECGYVTAEIKGRVTSVERRVDKTFFSFEVNPEMLELMYNHLKETGI